MSDVAIEIKELSKIFPPRVIALDNVNLDVYKGEFLVILGPSGSGKTTLLRSIAGLENPRREASQ
ncbi:MAG: ATP-binding cassette domain-containing protein [Desulfurococcus sp.]|nr:ATP-binding cassette domain-containing protein [Desulfurococcus sp.]